MGGYALAEYTWNAALLRRVFVVPEAVADEHLRLAGAVQLKVLLWLSRHNGEYDDEACSKAVGVSAADCRDALRYWVEAGVLSGSESSPQPAPVTPAPAPTKPVAARPSVVKPQMPEVIARREGCSEFAYLLDAVSARTGRPLSPGDMETLLYLFDTAGMPAEVILMVVGYAASAERCSMRYIEKVALDWADQGILTMVAAEEHLCQLERSQQAALWVQEVCGLDKVPNTAAARKTSSKWLHDWQVNEDVLRLAQEVCVTKTGKFQFAYIDRVLENWREQGAETPEKAAVLCGKPTESKQEEISEYEDMVSRYIPVYKKKKKKG